MEPSERTLAPMDAGSEYKPAPVGLEAEYRQPVIAPGADNTSAPWQAPKGRAPKGRASKGQAQKGQAQKGRAPILAQLTTVAKRILR